MFNEEMKRQYIKENCNVNQGIQAEKTFNSFEEMEISLGKDICCFTIDECDMLLNSYSLIVNSKRAVRSEAIKYVNWCIARGLANTNNFELLDIYNVSPSMVFNYRIKMFKDDESISKVCDVVLDILYSNTLHEMKKAYIMLLFNGITSQEIFHLKSEDVDLERGRVLYNSKEYKLYPKTIDAIKSIINAQYAQNIRKKYYENSPYLIKSFSNKRSEGLSEEDLIEYKSKTFQNTISTELFKAKARHKKTFYLSLTNIINSGIFYKNYLEEENGEKDCSVMQNKLFELYSRHYDSNDKSINKTQEFMEQKRNELLIEYTAWRKAFYE